MKRKYTEKTFAPEGDSRYAHVKPTQWARTLPGQPQRTAIARRLGYNSGAFNNWEIHSRIPYPAYLAIIDHFGRDETGAVVVEILDPIDTGRKTRLPLAIAPYVGLASLGDAPIPLDADTPAEKRKYARRADLVPAKVPAKVPAMTNGEMQTFIEERARHHVNNGKHAANGNGKHPQAFGLTLDIPDGFAGSQVRVEISPPRTAAH